MVFRPKSLDKDAIERAHWKVTRELWERGEKLLGERGWRLLRTYGRVMTGPHVGRYVSALPSELQDEVLQRLAVGESVPIHLMHMHRSGNYESSSLCLRDNALVMVFKDRELLA